MSVAFTKESDSESVAADLPDRPVSVHPNYVTAAGLAAIVLTSAVNYLMLKRIVFVPRSTA